MIKSVQKQSIKCITCITIHVTIVEKCKGTYYIVKLKKKFFMYFNELNSNDLNDPIKC